MATTMTTITRATAAAAATAAATGSFDPRNQTFFIAGPDGIASIPIDMATIEVQRVRLARLALNYGCQLGLALTALIVVPLLLPPGRLRRPLPLVQLAALLASATRLALLAPYFPGPLAGYYVAWTRDASFLGPGAYAAPAAAGALGVAQLALVFAALVLQAWALARTWPPDAWWRIPILALAALLAAGAVAAEAAWTAQRTRILRRGHVLLPVPLTRAGQASVALGAAAVFYFCGLFAAHLALHLASTARGGLRVPAHHPSRGRHNRRRCHYCCFFGRGAPLSSLEILALGNGILMLAPSLFAGLDIAANIGGTRVLPFDAGSWVLTLTTTGLPLISLIAHYRGAGAAASAGRNMNNNRLSRAVSLFFAKEQKEQEEEKEKEKKEAASSTTSNHYRGVIFRARRRKGTGGGKWRSRSADPTVTGAGWKRRRHSGSGSGSGNRHSNNREEPTAAAAAAAPVTMPTTTVDSTIGDWRGFSGGGWSHHHHRGDGDRISQMERGFVQGGSGSHDEDDDEDDSDDDGSSVATIRQLHKNPTSGGRNEGVLANFGEGEEREIQSNNKPNKDREEEQQQQWQRRAGTETDTTAGARGSYENSSPVTNDIEYAATAAEDICIGSGVGAEETTGGDGAPAATGWRPRRPFP